MRATVPCTLALGLAWAVAPAAAQTLYGYDSVNREVVQFTSVAGGACSAPLAVATPGWDADMAVCSKTQGSAAFGDVAVDQLRSRLYVSSGVLITQFNTGNDILGKAPGTPEISFWLPSGTGFSLPIEGMGIDSAGEVLWVTNGSQIMPLQLPSNAQLNSCGFSLASSTPVSVSVPNSGSLTDISWDPASGTLWACDDVGQVHNIQTDGTINSTIDVSGGATSCGLGTTLEGIAYDLNTPNDVFDTPAALFVTDGSSVAYLETSGAAAATTFYAPVSPGCTSTPQSIQGLAFAAHGITYGSTSSGIDLTPFGMSTQPGPTFGVTVDSPVSGSLFVLVSWMKPDGTSGPLCPGVMGGGITYWVDLGYPGFNTIVGPVPVTAGSFQVGLPIPGPTVITRGIASFVQIVIVDGGGAKHESVGLAMTLAEP